MVIVFVAVVDIVADAPCLLSWQQMALLELMAWVRMVAGVTMLLDLMKLMTVRVIMVENAFVGDVHRHC